MRRYKCIICGREVCEQGGDQPPPPFPFCSPRCQLVDLGKWLREDYAIDRDLTAEDLGDDLFPPE